MSLKNITSDTEVQKTNSCKENFNCLFKIQMYIINNNIHNKHTFIHSF